MEANLGSLVLDMVQVQLSSMLEPLGLMMNHSLECLKTVAYN